MEEKVKVFLKELEELTNKHGMYIWSLDCGRCGGICVHEVGTDNEYLTESLEFDKENKVYKRKSIMSK